MSHALVSDMEINKISQELLAQGWTKDQTPEGFRPWNDFYGGWEYSRSTYSKFTFKTPCGLLSKGTHIIGDMAYMGVNWMVENDNAIINCPYFDLRECPKRHPLLQGKTLYNYVSRCGNYKHCSVCQTSEPWQYEKSLEKVLDDNQAEEDALWDEFSERHHGRVCRYQSWFNMSEKTWNIAYDPRRCVQYGCRFCSVLGKELSEKKATVYFDLKKSWIEKGDGFMPDETRIIVTKGIKLLRGSETICESVVKVCKAEIQRKEELNNHSFIFFNGGTVEVLNLRVDRTPKRDLLQDLQDIAAGMSVVHQSDLDAAKKPKKRENRIASEQRRQDRFMKMIRTSGIDGLSSADRRRAYKHLSEAQIKQANREYEQISSATPKKKYDPIEGQMMLEV